MSEKQYRQTENSSPAQFANNCSIRIEGLSEKTTTEALINYFENTKRSNGGDVEDATIVGEIAFVLFANHEAARRVVERGNHAVDGSALSVSLIQPNRADTPDAAYTNNCSIRIEGLSEKTTTEALRNYFENTKRSNGGDVENATIVGETAFVLFAEHEAARRVVERGNHTIDGSALTVSLVQPNGACIPNAAYASNCSIRIEGLSEKTTTEALRNYFENTKRSNGGDVEDATIVGETAFVLFAEHEAARRVVERGNHTVDGSVLSVSLMQPNRADGPDAAYANNYSIRIEGLSEKTTTEALRNYFENTRRSSGGDVEDATILGETALVRFVDHEGIELPEKWDLQPKDTNGKEKDVHLVPLDPVKHAAEYDEVSRALHLTARANIQSIERVQNPALFRAYSVRKQAMDKKDGSNEMRLFHGTAGTSCQTINHFGFNRSYCGKNATALGKGVYFAKNASYSAQSTYSPPDVGGKRYMCYARVLVGQYTTGNSSMITPPPKNISNPTETYDTVADSGASIFVVFYDNQCYPDYLITFM